MLRGLSLLQRRNFSSSIISNGHIQDLFVNNSKKAIETFFRNPNTFDATFLIGRKEISFTEAARIYKTVEKNSSIQLLAEMILNSHRNKEHDYCEKLFKEKLIPLIMDQSYSFKSLKEYSWNRLFACLLIFKNKENLIFLYKKLKSECPNVVLNETNFKNLLNLFSECNESDLSLEILEAIKKPTVIDYSMVIKSLAKEGRIQQAFSLLSRMEEHLVSDAIIFIPLLKSCIEYSLQDEGFQIINMIRERNLSSPVLDTTIINFYFHFKMPDVALNFFKKNRKTSDAVTYGSIIQNLAKRGDTKEAILFIENMLNENLLPDHIALSFLIKNCEEYKLVDEGKYLHKLIVENEINHVSINTSLISFYSKIGEIEQSLAIFKSMSTPNNNSWNSILQALVFNGRLDKALDFYSNMKVESTPDNITFIILLKACADNGNLVFGHTLHTDIRKYGTSIDSHLLASLIVFYSKCGDFKNSLGLFLENKARANIVAWHAIVQQLLAMKKVDEAINMIDDMKNYNLEPDSLIFSSILKGCADNSKFQEGFSILKRVQKYQFSTSIHIQMAMVYFYGKNGDTVTCLEIFNKMKERNEANLPVYTTIIHSLISNKKIEEALLLFNEMAEEPDSILLSILLKACGDCGKYEEGKSIHKMIDYLTHGIMDTTLAGALVYFYCKFETNTAFKLFHNFKKSGKSNTLMWNSIIQLLLSKNRLDEAIDCFYQFPQFGIQPDIVTLTTILQACAENHDLGKGKIIHNYIKEINLHGDVILDRCLINFYSKCADLEMAKSIFQSIIDKKKEVNSYTFNSIIFACAEHGQANQCFDYFSQMIKHKIKPTPETFTALLTASSHSHRHKKALDIYNSMEQVFGIKPSDIHTSCLIDALSRSGKLDEAIEIIGERKEKVYWMTLLGACRKFNNIEVAEKAFQALVDIEPTDGSSYVLMSNIYTFNNETEKASNIRDLMKQNNASKVVGITSVYIGDEIHSFTSDDKKHPDNQLIQVELDKLINELIEAGYSPDTRWVTRTEILSTEEKHKLLCRHSEKIAMAYAFVRMPQTPKIVLFKNLRVCGDCHEASKFISKVRKCEIIVRDASRYHHMKDGKCSCGDNW